MKDSFVIEQLETSAAIHRQTLTVVEQLWLRIQILEERIAALERWRKS